MNYKSLIVVFLSFILLSGNCLAQEKRSKKKTKELTEKQYQEEADLFGKGLVEKSKGNLDEALKYFNKALEINARDAAAWYEIGRIYLSKNRKDEALEAAKKAFELDEENKWFLVLYANVSKANEQYDSYVTSYEELVKRFPNNLEFLNELAFAYYFTGDYKQAIVAYDKIEKEVGINEPLTTQKVGFYEKLDEPEKGLLEYQKLIDTNPNEPRYYAIMAEYCSRNGLDEQAIAAYEKIVELSPNDPYVHISLADYYNKKGETELAFEELKQGLANADLDLKTKINLLVNYYQGNLTESQKKHALALSEVLMETHPDDPLSHTFYASMLYENEAYKEARPLFKSIVETETANYVVWEQLLFCDFYLQDHTLLADDSEEAVDLFPNYPLPYFFAGLANFQLKDYVKAEAYLNSGKDFVVNNNALLEQFYSTLGDCYHAMKSLEKAYKAFDEVLSLNPENALVLNNYAYYLSLELKDLDKAETMAKKAVDLDPYNSNNLDTYAWVLFQQKNYKEALVWIEKAYNNEGSSSGVVLEHFGDILYRLGQKKEALEYWQKAAEKTEHSEFLDKKLKTKKIDE